MIARVAGTVILSTIGFMVVSLLVSLGVLWATGGVARGAPIGVICGSAAAFTVGAVSTAAGRSGEHSSEEIGRSGGSQDR
jgi:hypothetical protein